MCVSHRWDRIQTSHRVRYVSLPRSYHVMFELFLFFVFLPPCLSFFVSASFFCCASLSLSLPPHTHTHTHTHSLTYTLTPEQRTTRTPEHTLAFNWVLIFGKSNDLIQSSWVHMLLCTFGQTQKLNTFIGVWHKSPIVANFELIW